MAWRLHTASEFRLRDLQSRRLYEASGRLADVVFGGHLEEGYHTEWSRDEPPRGVYFLHAKTNDPTGEVSRLVAPE